MKNKIVGSYYAGNECVQLVLMPGYGGEFYTTPEDGAIARIKVGADDDWNGALTALFHEIFELMFDRVKCRLRPTNDISRSTASYIFVADHQDFGDVCARCAEFVNECLPDFTKEFKNWKKATKKEG